MISKLKEKFTIVYFIILVKSALWLLKFKSRKSVRFKSKYLRDFDEDENTVIDPWNPRIVVEFTNMSFAEDTDSVYLIIKPNKLCEFVTIRLEFNDDELPINIPNYFICSVKSGITSYKRFFFNFKNLRNTLILIQIFYFAKYNLFGYFLDKKRKSFIAKAGRTSPLSYGEYGNVVDLDIIIMKSIISIQTTAVRFNDECGYWSWDNMFDTGASYSFSIRLFDCNYNVPLDRFWNLYFNFLSTECLEIRKSFRKLKEGLLDPSAIQLGDIRKAVLLKEPVESCLLRIKNIIEFSNEVSRLI